MIQRKVCFVGDFAVGKSSLFDRFVYNRFADHYLSTVGVRVQRKTVVVDSRDIALILWDTDGGRGPDSLSKQALSGSAGAVVVGDLARRETLENCGAYITLLREINPQVHIVLAGNKLDLVETGHPHVALINDVAQQHGVALMLTSASSGANVEAMFQSLAEEL